MKTQRNILPRWLVVSVLGLLVFFGFAEPGMSQFSIGGIGIGNDDDSGVNIDIFQAHKTIRSAKEAKQGFTTEQEHYLGRAIAANILSEYELYEDATAEGYVTLLGQTVAAHSDRPQTFGGYRFLILDSDEINALAAPGGIVFVTRGMLRACENEDQLAAVLAHEVAHVQARHGVELIKDGRWKKFGTDAVFLFASSAGGGELGAAVDVFGDMVKDVTNEIMKNGYGKKLEKEADTAALLILQRIGYEPHECVSLMRNMEERFERGKKDFSKTHPKPKDRIKTIEKALKKGPDAHDVPQVRVNRFDSALGRARAD